MATSVATRLLDGQGRTITLGAEVGRGGEGSVYALEADGGLLAKRYHRPPDARLSAKLAAMASARTDSLARTAAWPIATLHDGPSGVVVGFLMPRVAGYDAIHFLYSPKSRLHHFPDAGWPFLVHVAANLARAFAIVHSHGHVIGDVNHGNVLVSPRGLVRLIDCDSFQVAHAGRRYLCDVGVATHTPPELQGQSFHGVTRTPNHDAFGLAVLIFQLLFLGRHPFSGMYLGPGEMPLERAIKEFRFAYGARASQVQMRAPPGVLPLEAASAPVAALFERAFAPQAARGGRPKPTEWTEALLDLERRLRTCDTNGGHHFAVNLATCPWCALEQSAGVAFFRWTAVVGSSVAASFDLAAVWGAIQAVAAPGEAPPLPDGSRLVEQPSAQARRAGRRRRARYGIALAAFVAITAAVILLQPGVVFGVGALFGGLVVALLVGRSGKPTALIKEAEAARVGAQAAWRDVTRQWATLNDEPYQSLLRELEDKKRRYEQLPERRARALQQLDSDQRIRQLTRFLGQHRLDTAAVERIGPVRVAMLQSHGVVTAADISEARLAAVRGFGPALAGALLDWRRGVERRFIFDPLRASPMAEAQAIEQEIAAERARLERDLRAGEEALRQMARSIADRRARLHPVAVYAAQQVAKAEAERNAL